MRMTVAPAAAAENPVTAARAEVTSALPPVTRSSAIDPARMRVRTAWVTREKAFIPTRSRVDPARRFGS
jgi:hypothetical protein